MFQRFARSHKVFARPFSTSIENVKRIGIIGAGQMGTGIGIVASRVAGLNVTFVDPKEAQLKSAERMVDKWCDKEIGKGRVTEEQKG